MTLAVCKIRGPNVFIFSDTRIDKQGLRLPPHQGVLKTTLLSPTAAISFCNSPELAIRDIREFGDQYRGTFTYREALNFFEHSSNETNNDYLLVLMNPLRVVKIARGNGKRVSHQDWIGDYPAFCRFREYQTRSRPGADLWQMNVWENLNDKADDKTFSDVLALFQETLADPEISTAGDFYTIVTNVGSELKFIFLMHSYFDGLGPYPVNPTSGENFDYRFSIIAPTNTGTNACAFYYPHSKHGYLFHSKSNREVADQCVVSRDVGMEGFVKLCRSVVGVKFGLGTMMHGKPPEDES
jgi:hypothetical protein